MTITMYGADWCGDCRRAKTFFEANELEYRYVNAEEVPEATEIILERNGGVQRIPVVVFDDDSHLTEPTDDELATKVADLAAGDSYVVIKAQNPSRYELHHNGELVSYADFTQEGSVVTVPHVTTLPTHRGRGNAARLMDGVLRDIRMQRGSITPLCPFAAGHMRDNPRWHTLLAS